MEQQIGGPTEPIPDPISQGQPDEGQAAEGQVVETPEEPFFSVKDGDEERVFKNPDELRSAWKESYMRRSDYTKKTQEVAALRKKLEQQQKELEEKSRKYTRADEYEKLDKLAKTRPDVYRQFQSALSRPPNPEVAYERSQQYVEEQLGPLKEQLDEFKQWREAQEREREKKEVYQKLKEQYEDFDPETIESYMEEIQGAGLSGVMEAFYHAIKGKENPIKAEQRIAENFKKKQKAAVPGGGAPLKGSPIPKSLDEAHNLALKEIE